MSTSTTSAVDVRPRWLPIESNPDVMNKFLRTLGMPDMWTITDVYGLDEPLLAMIPQPVLAFILLFPDDDKYNEFARNREAVAEDQVVAKDLWYSKQTIHNACGTMAMLHAACNNMELLCFADGPLKRFFEETKELSPEERAKRLEENAEIREVHESVGRQGQTATPDINEEVEHHFIALVQKEGHLYELDGAKKCPINCGPTSDGTFVADAAKVCKMYMERNPENISFTIVALTAAED